MFSITKIFQLIIIFETGTGIFLFRERERGRKREREKLYLPNRSDPWFETFPPEL